MIVFIAPLTEASGNVTTTQRILKYLEESGCGEVGMVDANKPAAERAKIFDDFERSQGIGLTVTLHAYKGGKALLEYMKEKKPVPNITVFGGTDINENVNDEVKKNIMSEVLARSCRAVCFSQDMKDRAIAAFGSNMNIEYDIAPQAVIASVPDREKLSPIQSLLPSFFSNHRHSSSLRLFIAPMGVRPVKDPLFLLKAFPKVHQQFPDAYCVVVGPILDKNIGDDLINQDEEQSGVCYSPAMPQQDLHELYTKECVVAVINCSLSEGQPQAAMEGMRLGTPALLRSISGNTAIAENDVTALFFDDAQSFSSQAIKLLSSDCTAIARSGREHVENNFSSETESRYYKTAAQSAYALYDKR